MTRWGSMEKMVSRLLEQEVAVRVILSEDRKTTHLIPTWQDIQVWESISSALSPIADLTDLLSGDSHVTVSSIQPVLRNLRHKVLVEKESDTTLTKNIKTGVLEDLQRRYSGSKLTEILGITTFLDPRFKADYADDIELELLEDVLVDRGINLDTMTGQTGDAQHANQPLEPAPIDAAPVAPPAPKKRKLVTFLKKDQSAGEQVAGCTRSPLQKLQSEINAYKTSPKLEVESEETPLQWWKSHETTYLVLSKLAMKYLCICATSCPSERLFSTAGNIVTSTRARLKPHRVNMLVFLAKNL